MYNCINVFVCIVMSGFLLISETVQAQLPNMDEDEAIRPMASQAIKRTFQSREFEGAYPGTVLGKKDYHFDRKFNKSGTITHNELKISTSGQWTIEDDKMCIEFDDYHQNRCFRIYEMGNCFYFYADSQTDKYLKGREFDRWETRLVPKNEDGLCRVFIYKKVPGQAPILISPIY